MVTLKRSEIADVAATTTETAIRTLAQLSNDGLIDLSGKQIVVNDFKGLVREAGIYD